jgi:ketosteroid isomerase-like protein
MKRTYFFLVFLLIFSACSNNKRPDVNELFEADRNFSNMSVEKGFPAAFAEFADTQAVILRPNSMPVKGKNAIAELYSKADTAGVHFTWEPLTGDIAASGELGYTYGTYTFIKDTITERVTYASVWKKDENGSWKYVLDIGNEGLGN